MPAASETSVPALLAGLWGTPDLPRDAGVLHVVSTWVEAGVAYVIRITDASPPSPTDFFLLNLARARADAILTTGAILRHEPSLRYDLQGPHAEALHRWRRAELGRDGPPRVLVLTRGDIDLDHPAFDSWARPVIVTESAGASRLRSAAQRRNIEVVSVASASASAAIAWARASGAATIGLEAGPSTMRALYADPIQVDELMISEFLEPALAHELRGPSLFTPHRNPAAMGSVTAVAERREPSGRWRFSRYVRT